MTRLRLLPAAGRPIQNWKNGGGKTSEIAVYPPRAGLDDFEWRLSTAWVTSAGPFSCFEGVDRALAVVDGTLELAFDAGPDAIRLTSESVAHQFPADVGVVGTPIDGGVVDLNLMMRRGRWAGTIEIVDPAIESSLLLSSDLIIVLCTRETTICFLGEERALTSMDALRIEGAREQSIQMHSQGKVYIFGLDSISG